MNLEKVVSGCVFKQHCNKNSINTMGSGEGFFVLFCFDDGSTKL